MKTELWSNAEVGRSVNGLGIARMRLWALMAFCVGIGLTVGCGYRVRGTGEPVGVSIQSLAIPMMETPASSLGAESDFTGMIREEFVSHARLPLVSREEASAVLIGKVHAIKSEPYTYRITETVVGGESTTYEVTNARWLKVRMEAKLVESATGRVIWEERNMNDKATYRVGPDPLVNRENERAALRKIAKAIARRIYTQTMERF